MGNSNSKEALVPKGEQTRLPPDGKDDIHGKAVSDLQQDAKIKLGEPAQEASDKSTTP